MTFLPDITENQLQCKASVFDACIAVLPHWCIDVLLIATCLHNRGQKFKNTFLSRLFLGVETLVHNALPNLPLEVCFDQLRRLILNFDAVFFKIYVPPCYNVTMKCMKILSTDGGYNNIGLTLKLCHIAGSNISVSTIHFYDFFVQNIELRARTLLERTK